MKSSGKFFFCTLISPPPPPLLHSISIRCRYSHNEKKNVRLCILSWSSGLNLARVTHWGGMISTPDVALQEIIRTTLMDNGCPTEITEQLMTNAHERHWPEGLSTLGEYTTSR